MAKYFVSIKNEKNQYKIFKVKKEVYTYIHQLETAIRFPQESKIKDLYPERFK